MSLPKRPFTTSSLTSTLKSTLASQPLLNNLTNIDKLSSQASSIAQRTPFFGAINNQFNQHHQNDQNHQNPSMAHQHPSQQNPVGQMNRNATHMGPMSSSSSHMMQANQKPAAAGQPQPPSVDMSHLTEEERLMIQSVMAKAEMADKGIPVDTSSTSTTNAAMHPSSNSLMMNRNPTNTTSTTNSTIQHQQTQLQRPLNQSSMPMNNQQQQTINPTQNNSMIGFQNQANNANNPNQFNQPTQQQQNMQQNPSNITSQILHNSQNQSQQQQQQPLQQLMNNQPFGNTNSINPNQQQQMLSGIQNQNSMQLDVGNNQLAANINQQQNNLQQINASANNMMNNQNGTINNQFQQPQVDQQTIQPFIRSTQNEQMLFPNDQQQSALNQQQQQLQQPPVSGHNLFNQQLNSSQLGLQQSANSNQQQQLQQATNNFQELQQQPPQIMPTNQQQQFNLNPQQQPQNQLTQQIIQPTQQQQQVPFNQNTQPQQTPSNFNNYSQQTIVQNAQNQNQNQINPITHQLTQLDSQMPIGGLNLSQLQQQQQQQQQANLLAGQTPQQPQYDQNNPNLAGQMNANALVNQQQMQQQFPAPAQMNPNAGYMGSGMVQLAQPASQVDLQQQQSDQFGPMGLLRGANEPPNVRFQLPNLNNAQQAYLLNNPTEIDQQHLLRHQNSRYGFRRYQTIDLNDDDLGLNPTRNSSRNSGSMGQQYPQRELQAYDLAMPSLGGHHQMEVARHQSPIANKHNSARQLPKMAAPSDPYNNQKQYQSSQPEKCSTPKRLASKNHPNQKQKQTMVRMDSSNLCNETSTDAEPEATVELDGGQHSATSLDGDEVERYESVRGKQTGSRSGKPTTAPASAATDKEPQIATEAMKLLKDLKLTEQANQVMEQQQQLIKQSQELIRLQLEQQALSQELKKNALTKTSTSSSTGEDGDKTRQTNTQSSDQNAQQDDTSNQLDENNPSQPNKQIDNEKRISADRLNVSTENDTKSRSRTDKGDDDCVLTREKQHRNREYEQDSDRDQRQSARDNQYSSSSNRLSPSKRQTNVNKRQQDHQSKAARDADDRDSSYGEAEPLYNRKISSRDPTGNQLKNSAYYSAANHGGPSARYNRDVILHQGVDSPINDTTDSEMDPMSQSWSQGVSRNRRYQHHHCAPNYMNNKMVSRRKTPTTFLVRRRVPTGLSPSPLPVTAAIQLHQMQQQHFQQTAAAAAAAQSATATGNSSYSRPRPLNNHHLLLKSRSVTNSPTNFSSSNTFDYYNNPLHRSYSPDALSELGITATSGSFARRKKLPDPPSNAVPVTPSMVKQIVQAQGMQLGRRQPTSVNAKSTMIANSYLNRRSAFDQNPSIGETSSTMNNPSHADKQAHQLDSFIKSGAKDSWAYEKSLNSSTAAPATGSSAYNRSAGLASARQTPTHSAVLAGKNVMGQDLNQFITSILKSSTPDIPPSGTQELDRIISNSDNFYGISSDAHQRSATSTRQVRLNPETETFGMNYATTTANNSNNLSGSDYLSSTNNRTHTTSGTSSSLGPNRNDYFQSSNSGRSTLRPYLIRCNSEGESRFSTTSSRFNTNRFSKHEDCTTTTPYSDSLMRLSNTQQPPNYMNRFTQQQQPLTSRSILTSSPIRRGDASDNLIQQPTGSSIWSRNVGSNTQFAPNNGNFSRMTSSTTPMANRPDYDYLHNSTLCNPLRYSTSNLLTNNLPSSRYSNANARTTTTSNLYSTTPSTIGNSYLHSRGSLPSSSHNPIGSEFNSRFSDSANLSSPYLSALDRSHQYGPMGDTNKSAHVPLTTTRQHSLDFDPFSSPYERTLNRTNPMQTTVNRDRLNYL